MTAGLFVLLVASLAIPAARGFYELKLPDFWGFCMIVLVIVAWGFTLRAVWRSDLLERGWSTFLRIVPGARKRFDFS